MTGDVTAAVTAEAVEEAGLRRTVRMEAFSDGVFAIAITLLVLELPVPGHEQPWHDLLRHWPSYLGYLVGFAAVGSVWLAHSLITEYLHRANAVLLRLNLLLLFFVSLVPFPTRMLSEFLDNKSGERIAVTIFGIDLVMMALLNSLLWRYARSHDLVHPDMADAELTTLTAKFEPGLIGYLVAIGIGLLAPRIAVALYLLTSIFLMLPLGALRRRRHRRRAPA